MSFSKDCISVAKVLLNMAFGDDNKSNKLYLENALKLVSSCVRKLQKLENDDYVTEIVWAPRNGGWIKAFYDFHESNPENKHDVRFVYIFKDGEKSPQYEKIVKQNDIIGWAEKWYEYRDKKDSLKLLMGNDCWNGKLLEIDKYTTNSVRFKLFGKQCINKGKNIQGCYGNVFMDEVLFTRTKNNNHLCKFCEANRDEQSMSEASGALHSRGMQSLTSQHLSRKDEESVPRIDFPVDFKVAEEVALKVLEGC